MATPWTIWTTVTPVLLWRLRNKLVFDGIQTSMQNAQAIVWAAGIYQAKAIASSWLARPVKRIQGHCLDVCLRIVMTIAPDTEIQQLEMWLLRYHVRLAPTNSATGSWMIYQLHNETSWNLHEASSLQFCSRGHRKDNAKWVLKHGMQAITQQTDPTQVLLRVESIEAAMPLTNNKSRARTAKATSSAEDACTKLLRSFFAVQWGKPKLSQLEAVKRLANSDTTTTFTFNTTADVASTSSMRSYVERTAQHLHIQGKPLLHVQNRKAESIQDRLTAFQASIGKIV